MMTAQNAAREIKRPQNYEIVAWKWMRYSAIALLPLVWIHVLIQDVVVGVHAIAETQGGGFVYVIERWGNPFWITYDILLLAFAFAHGMNGLRQVAMDFVHGDSAKRVLSWVIFVGWAVISAIGAYAIIAAAAANLAGS
jgi:succinate dehydrogenase / fumarate reductase membrane anchor subunit